MVYQQSGLSPKDVSVLEVHDCFSSNELMMYEAMGLCDEGKAASLLDNGDWITNSEGGELFELRSSTDKKGWVVNPSGGLESKGHPLGATGLAQCAELCWQVSLYYLIEIIANSNASYEVKQVNGKYQMQTSACNTTLVWALLL